MDDHIGDSMLEAKQYAFVTRAGNISLIIQLYRLANNRTNQESYTLPPDPPWGSLLF